MAYRKPLYLHWKNRINGKVGGHRLPVYLSPRCRYVDEYIERMDASHPNFDHWVEDQPFKNKPSDETR